MKLTKEIKLKTEVLNDFSKKMGYQSFDDMFDDGDNLETILAVLYICLDKTITDEQKEIEVKQLLKSMQK